MISKNEISHAAGWGFSAGCKNRFWLVGNVVKADRDNHCIYLSREEPGKVSDETAIVAHLRPEDRFPRSVAAGETIKLVGHLHSGATADMDSDEAAKGMRHLHLKVLGIDRPGLLDSKLDEDRLDESDGLLMPERFTRASNEFAFAGFVITKPFQAEGRMIVVVGQSESREHYVPFELSTQKGMRYRNALVPGMPVVVTGMIEPRQVQGVGVRPVARVRDFHRVDAEKDLLFSRLPDWVRDIQIKSGLRRAESANQGEKRETQEA